MINNMGSSTSQDLNSLAKEIWQWCVERDTWISCAPGVGLDDEADVLSRKFHTDTEWKLDAGLLHEAPDLLSTTPTIDLFASRTDHQFPKYVSFQPDPIACFTDAFSIDCSSHIVYCFPPFSLLPRVLRKIQTDKAEGIVVAPLWKKKQKNNGLADAHRHADNDTSTTVAPGLASHFIQRQDTETSLAEQAGQSGIQSIRVRFETSGLFGDAASIVMSSWRLASKKCMTCTCGSGKGRRVSGEVDSVSPPLAEGVNFLPTLV